MAVHSISRSLFHLHRSKNLTTTAESYWNLLQKNPSEKNLEKTLSETSKNLDASSVEKVLQKSSLDRSLALRFFIWAGQQSNYRHSRLMYSKASEFLKISQYPETLTHILDDYKRDMSWVSVKTFKVIFNLCQEAKLAELALGFLKRMGEFNCRPDTASYNVLIRLFAEKNDMGFAEGLMREMRMIGLYPDMITCVAMIKGFCNVGRLEDARWVFDEMPKWGCLRNVVVYSALLEGFCKGQRMEMGIELLSEMEKKSEGGSGCECAPNVVTYTTLIQSFCEKGRAKEAVEVLDRMGKHGCVPNRVTVCTLLDGLCKEGYVEDAHKVIDRIVGEGSLSSSQCYSSMVVSLLRLRSVGEAENLVRRMLAGGVRPDGLASSTLVKEVCLDGRSLDGFSWYYEIEKDCLSAVDSDVYSVLLAGLCEQDHLVEAATLIDVMVERGIRLRAPYVNRIVEHLKKTGENDLVLRLRSIGG
ncbi:pentatricopeptide repeat-containing protein At5g47360-like [Tasmannia lanceolata]|uniref:pentatricopeptide repeat-containing protein At5g47360-like n=1 Tax=Tasmannia lanceolata TaxID=3420 RepID=UPI004062B4B3